MRGTVGAHARRPMSFDLTPLRWTRTLAGLGFLSIVTLKIPVAGQVASRLDVLLVTGAELVVGILLLFVGSARAGALGAICLGVLLSLHLLIVGPTKRPGTGCMCLGIVRTEYFGVLGVALAMVSLGCIVYELQARRASQHRR
jgi:hypothetical protein